MKEFVFGTQEAFDGLENALRDGLCHVYDGCVMPAGCTPATARIGFECSQGVYLLYIDKGIDTKIQNEQFCGWLKRGTVKFTCMDDMAEFLHSLQPLFAASTEAPPAPIPKDQPLSYDPNKLEKLYSNGQLPEDVWPEQIADPLKQKIFGQDRAIDEIARKISINLMHKPPRLLTMAFLGPTATGKTESAKYLAQVMTKVTGKQYGLIQIAGSEFVGPHTVHRFFGAPPGYVGNGSPTLLEPARSNPYQVIVMDEIEKGDVQVVTALMETIDRGVVEMADNTSPIDLNRCILIFTSNIAVDRRKYSQIESDFLRSEFCRNTFTQYCHRPEISGKISNFLVFDPLSPVACAHIVDKFIREELNCYDIRLGRVEESLMLDFLQHRTEYGARGIQNLIGEAMGKYLLYDRRLQTLRGKTVNLRGSVEKLIVEPSDEI